ncbi:MAG TPA: rod shape-determining protein MreD [Gaiellaceae bacterium]|jgi:rod shape-determining protein MreD|nr:rod shape-determining protein MreD [Gaiellaceae bacterium]
MIADAVKAALVLFACAVVQSSVLGALDVLGGTPDLVLVALVCVALLRGSIFGAVAGFWAGFLLDTATLDTLGVTALLLTVAGFWIGRYGETTARDRTHAPFTSVLVVSVLAVIGALVLDYVLGEAAPARAAFSSLPATVVLNLILTLPVYAVARRLFPPREAAERGREVQLLG